MSGQSGMEDRHSPSLLVSVGRVLQRPFASIQSLAGDRGDIEPGELRCRTGAEMIIRTTYQTAGGDNQAKKSGESCHPVSAGKIFRSTG